MLMDTIKKQYAQLLICAEQDNTEIKKEIQNLLEVRLQELTEAFVATALLELKKQGKVYRATSLSHIEKALQNYAGLKNSYFVLEKDCGYWLRVYIYINNKSALLAQYANVKMPADMTTSKIDYAALEKHYKNFSPALLTYKEAKKIALRYTRALEKARSDFEKIKMRLDKIKEDNELVLTDYQHACFGELSTDLSSRRPLNVSTQREIYLNINGGEW